MNPFWNVLRTKLRIVRHQIASVRHESKLKVGVIALSAIGLWLGAFVFLLVSFNWLLRFGGRGGATLDFGPVLMQNSLDVFALAIFLLLIFSNTLIAYSTLYRSHETLYLLQGPLSYRTFFYARFVECIIFSSWSLAFLGSPLMLAYGISANASVLYYCSLVFFYVPYVLLPACLGALLAMFLVHLSQRLRARWLVLLGLLVLGAFFFYLQHSLRRIALNEDMPLAQILAALRQAHSPFFPSSWAADGVIAAAAGNLGEAAFQLALLIANALLLLWICGEVAARIFFRGWSWLQGMDRKTRRRRRKSNTLHPAMIFTNPFRVLAVKDLKLFWRDPTQWMQFVIFFGIMAVYIANMRNMSHFYSTPVLRDWIAALNVGAIALILASLTSRFVFPLVSLEGRRFWIIRLAPVTIGQIVWQKYWVSVGLTSSFTVAITALSGLILRLPWGQFWLTIYSVAAINLTLAGLAVGLGSLYPNFEEDNPARIVSGMGGTLNLLLSVFYIFLVVTIQTLVLHWEILGIPYVSHQGAAFAAFGTITCISLFFCAVPLHLGFRHLRSLDI